MKKNKKLLSLVLGLSIGLYSCFGVLFSSAMPIYDEFDEETTADSTIHILSSSVIEVTLDKPEYSYTGSQITPEVVSVHYQSGTFDQYLEYGDDYICEYGENVEIGTGTVKIIGSENTEKDDVFWGSVTVEFDIVEADESSEVIDESSEVVDESSESDSSSTVDEPEGEVIWEGNLSLSDWSQDGYLGIANISGAKEGGIVTIYATPNGDAKLQISGKDANDTWFDMRNTDGHSFYITDGKSQIVLNAEQANILANARQLVLKGVNYTATMITYLAPDEPDSSSEVIDESSEVIDESSEVIDESSEVIDESSEVIDDSSEVINDSSEVVDDTEPEYVSTNLTLTGLIGANSYYKVPQKYISDNYTVEVAFTASGVPEKRIALDTSKTEVINGENTYVFTLPVRSCDMAKRFRARLYVKTADGEQVFVSPANTVMLNNYISSFANTGTETQKAFAKAMQTYGYYSQKVFTNSAPADVTPIDLSDVTYSKLKKYQPTTEDNDGVQIKGDIFGTTLFLDSGTGIRSYVTNLENVDTDNLYMQYTENGVTTKVKAQYSAEKDAYYGEVADVPAGKLSSTYRICFVEGNKQITDAVLYGAYSYVYSTLKSPSSTEDQKNLARALYKYSRAAEDLFNEEPDSSSVAESSSEAEESSEVIIDSSSEDESSEVESSDVDSSSTIDDETLVIWEGNQDIDKWKSFEIEGVAGIPDAEEGGVLTVYGTPIDPAKKAQVQFATTQGEDYEWTTLEDKAGNDGFDVIGGKVQFVLSAENAALLRSANSMHLNGTNVTVTRYTYNAPGTLNASEVIWEGSEDITAWTQDVSLGVANIPLAEEGGKIIVEATAIGDAPQIQISGNDINWDWFDIKDPATGEAYDLTGDSVTIVLYADSADTIANAKKLFVKGIDVNVTKVTYIAPNGSLDSSSVAESSSKVESSSKTDSSSAVKPDIDVIWEGNMTVENWNQDGDINVANIPQAEEGGVLTIYATNNGDAKVQISGKDANDNWFDMRNTDGHSFYVNDGKVVITLTDEQANTLATARQLVLKGQDYTATKITYKAPSTNTDNDFVIW